MNSWFNYLLLLASVAPAQRPDTAWFSATLPLVVRAAESDARSQAYPGSGRGPLMLDVNELSRLGTKATGQRISRNQVLRAVASRFRESPRGQGIQCTGDSTGHACWVRDDGVFVQIDSLVRTGDRVRAGVTTVTTERVDAGRPGTCHRTLLITIARSEGVWRLTDTTLWATC